MNKIFSQSCFSVKSIPNMMPAVLFENRPLSLHANCREIATNENEPNFQSQHAPERERYLLAGRVP